MNPSTESTIFIATRGSALALAQSNQVLNRCRLEFPDLTFELKIIRTTGDKLQNLSLTHSDQQLPKGLFTKELEVSLLNGEATLAVHSLKDLPTELPAGLKLAAVSPRADVRDVLITLAAQPGPGTPGTPTQREPGTVTGATVKDLSSGATIATSSTRRQAQLLALRPDLNLVAIRGNVGTRLQKLAGRAELDGLVLAAAGLERLGIRIGPEGVLGGEGVPPGLRAIFLSLDEMLPCVGQAALGLETRIDDPRADRIAAGLNDLPTFQCVTGERAFLEAMGGGCMSPVACLGERVGGDLRLRAVTFRDQKTGRAEIIGDPGAARDLGRALAETLR